MSTVWYSDMCKEVTDVSEDDIEVIEVDDDLTEKHIHHVNYKVTVLGKSKVGKSAIIGCISGKEFQENMMTTVGIDFTRKKFRCENAIIQLTIYDSAGQDKYRVISGFQLKNTLGVVLVYDITNRTSFEAVSYFIDVIEKEINLQAEEPIPVFLVSNKSDLESQRVVTIQEGKQLADKLFVQGFYETSAKNGQNVFKLFSQLAKSATEIYNPKLLDSFLCREEKEDLAVKRNVILDMKIEDVKNDDAKKEKKRTLTYRLRRFLRKHLLCSRHRGQ